jgi:FkbM family methyltransferase
LNFAGANHTWWVVPLMNYNFTDDHYIGSFILEFYDINKNLVDSKELKIKDVFNKIENVGTRIYDGFDSLWINYKQMFLDKIYDVFIDDNIETVIDVGANVGIFSNYISWKKNVKLIHAIEPVSKPFEELKKQFYYYHHIKCHKLGIHYNSGKDFIKVDHNQSILNTFLNVSTQTNSVEEVNVSTLPEFMDNCALNTVDLIKLDVEGLEYEILNSMNDKQILRSKNWLIEYHINYDGKAEILQNRFSRLGYLVTNVPDQIPNNIGIQGFFFAKKI